jgi:spectinomycin phosphotransferase
MTFAEVAVLLPPRDLDEQALLHKLHELFEIESGRLTFVPQGEDSWCYRVDDLWVNVRRDLRGHVPAAYEFSHELRSAGLTFVLSPLAGADGRLVRRIGRYPVIVFPYVPSEQLDAGSASKQDIQLVRDMLARLHATTTIAARLPVEDYRLSFDDDIATILPVASAGATERGPYTSRLVDLIRKHHATIAVERVELLRLSAVCSQMDAPHVLTHGEPCAPNFLRTADGLMLVDWGEAAWGPPERDLFHVARTIASVAGCRPQLNRFYQVR